MPNPPPPPPPGPPLPPVMAINASKSKSSSNDGQVRNALLQSIRQGKPLKKTVTNDRSQPLVGGTAAGSGNNTNSSNTSNASNTLKRPGGGGNLQIPNGLANIFAGGMPKLKQTGLAIPGQTSTLQKSDSNANAPSAAAVSPNVSSLHSNRQEGTVRQFSTDIRNRGPPPQPPPVGQKPVMPNSASDSVLTNSNHHNRMGSTASLNSDVSPRLVANGPAKAPPSSHGKPNVAPKPPNTLNKPTVTPPKKLIVNGRPTVSRAQSMKAPRSPPVSLPAANAPQFSGTLSHSEINRLNNQMNSISFHQSQETLNSSLSSRPIASLPGNSTMWNSTGTLRHRPGTPIRPPNTRPPPPPSKVAMNPPVCPPPPLPTTAPPLPPHRTTPAPPPPRTDSIQNRSAPSVPSGAPPLPPVRNTNSLRNGSFYNSNDLESRFGEFFHSVHEFPPPQSYKGVIKQYNSRTAKQQAPQPPTHSMMMSNRM